jgi:osmotically-inducible protein OsmY
MANRQQNYQSRPWDYDDNRAWRERDREYGQRDYGQYADTDEGESSVRAGSYDQGRVQYGRRHAGYGDFGQGDYNQPVRGGRPNYSYGQPTYGQDFGSSGTSNYGRSSYDSPGMHRGKGPKNYQRSDERVKELLCERLHDDPEIDASEITVSVQGGRITLEGTVDSRRTKMMVEDVADQIGVQDVQNNLRVQRQGERGMDAGSRSSPSTMGRSALGNEDGEQSKRKGN